MKCFFWEIILLSLLRRVVKKDQRNHSASCMIRSHSRFSLSKKFSLSHMIFRISRQFITSFARSACNLISNCLSALHFALNSEEFRATSTEDRRVLEATPMLGRTRVNRRIIAFTAVGTSG